MELIQNLDGHCIQGNVQGVQGLLVNSTEDFLKKLIINGKLHFLCREICFFSIKVSFHEHSQFTHNSR